MTKEETKLHQLEYQKQYYKKHKVAILKRQALYREKNKEKCNELQRNWISRWRKNNEEYAIKRKEYYQNNKERLLAIRQSKRETFKDWIINWFKWRFIVEEDYFTKADYNYITKTNEI